jgi:hypothetical protein
MTTHAGHMEDAPAHAGALPSVPAPVAPEMTGMRRFRGDAGMHPGSGWREWVGWDWGKA